VSASANQGDALDRAGITVFRGITFLAADPAGERSPSAAEASSGMKRRRRAFWAIVVLLYAATWIGGWITHARDLRASAQARYQRAQERNREWMANEPAGEELPTYLQMWEGGPATGVNWCIPLLPSVLLADSYEVLGPLNGRGMVKLVFYYGVGSVVICDLWGWIS
jgi:hypothetical protein